MSSNQPLPVKNKGMFKRAIGALKRKHKNNQTVIHKINDNWKMLYCVASNHYYAVQTDAVSTIQSGRSCIRPAYRIDPTSGECLAQELTEGSETKLYYKFAIKEYTTIRGREEAEIEVETLQQHQFAEELLTNRGNPIVVSIYFPGEPVTSLAGMTTPLLNKLSFLQRLNLLFQLSNQYYQLHHHEQGRKLHIDVKGQNVIVNVEENGECNIRIIDFGSVRRVTHEAESVETSLIGLTPYAIPPEAIQSAVQEQRGAIQADEISGEVSSKSDLYALTAVFASILGEFNPYQDRHCSSDLIGHIDVGAVLESIDNGFKTSSLFLKGKKLSYHFSGEANCAFKKIEGIAPSKEWIIAEISENRCYLEYKNYLLYKEGNQVEGYKRRLRNLSHHTRAIEPTDNLNQDDLAKLDVLLGFKRKNQGESLQSLLESRIRRFLELMSENSVSKRPKTKVFFEFFKTVYQLASLAEERIDPFNEIAQNLNDHEISRVLSTGLIKLDFMYLGVWELALIPVESSIDTNSLMPISSFNFMSLYQDEDFQTKLGTLAHYVKAIETYLKSEEEEREFPSWPESCCVTKSKEYAKHLTQLGVFQVRETIIETTEHTNELKL